jgi:hypothetical protein
MALPRLTTPTFKTNLPSIGDVTYRPYLVKEEKVLLMALESNSIDETIRAMVNVMQACVIKPKIDFSRLPFYEAEFLFLKIRAKSAGEVIDLNTRHIDGINSKGEECKHVQPIQVNIDELSVPGIQKQDRVVMLTEKVGVELRAPSLSEFYSMMEQEDSNDRAMNLLATTIDKVFEDDNVVSTSEITKEELVDFIEQLTTKQCELISDFYMKIPSLKIVVPYTCTGCGSEETITIEGIRSFFR